MPRVVTRSAPAARTWPDWAAPQRWRWRRPTTSRAAAADGLGADPAAINDWNATTVAVLADAGRPNPEAYMWLAFAHAAMYNAVAGITGRYALYKWAERGPATASPEAAAAAAANRMLLTYFGPVPAARARLADAYAAALGRVPGGAAKEQGVAYGERAADRILALREGDGRSAALPFTVAPAPGVWRPTPPANAPFLAPWLSRLRPLDPDRRRRHHQLGGVQRPAAGLGRRPQPGRHADQRPHGDRLDQAVPGAGAAGARLGDLRRRVRRGQGARGQGEPRAHPRPDRDGPVHLRHRRRAAAGVDSRPGRPAGAGHQRPGPPVRGRDHERRGRGNSLLGLQVPLRPVAPDHRHPPRRRGRQPGDGGRPGLGAADRHPALPGLLQRRELARRLRHPGHESASSTPARIDLYLTSPATNTTRHYESADALCQDTVDARVWSGLHFRTADVVALAAGRQVADWVLDHYLQPLRT